MTDTGAHPTPDNDPSPREPSPRPGREETPASFARHDVDVDAPDDARGGHEQASFDRHDTDVDAPDSVIEYEEATFDRHDVNVGEADAVHEGDANFDRHDSE
jgi:hypothetical protein